MEYDSYPAFLTKTANVKKKPLVYCFLAALICEYGANIIYIYVMCVGRCVRVLVLGTHFLFATRS